MTLNIFANLLGGLVDKEKAVQEIIQTALEDALEEVNETRNEGTPEYTHENIFIMIMPSDEKMNFKLYLYKNAEGKRIPVREISIKEILRDE